MWRVKTNSKFEKKNFPVLIYWNDNRIHLGFSNSGFSPPPNEGGPKSKSARKEAPLKIQKYKEKHVSGKKLEKKMFSGMSAPTPARQSEENGLCQ